MGLPETRNATSRTFHPSTQAFDEGRARCPARPRRTSRQGQVTLMSVRTLAALAALALLPAVATPAHASRTFSFTGDDVAVWNPAGQVRIEAGSGGAVEVQVDLQGRDADRVRLDDQSLGGRPTLRVLYSDARVVYPPMGRWSNTNTTMRSDG